MLRGRIIGLFGLPGSGKSTLARLMGEALKVSFFCEPEEGAWPEAIHNKNEWNYAANFHWFRLARLSCLHKAAIEREQGKIAFIDSLYDKLWWFCLGKPGMDWLIPPDDPYFSNIKELARLDVHHLPDPDMIIFLKVLEADWGKMIEGRGRKLDRSRNLPDFFSVQQLFEDAATEYVQLKKDRVQLIAYVNRFSTPEIASREVLQSLNLAEIETRQ